MRIFFMGHVIAVIDDEVEIQTALKTFLEHEGYRVIAAGSVDEFVQSIGSQPVDAFMVDVMIGPDCGFDLCRRIRLMPAHQRTPILCMTGRDYPGVLQDAFNAGADDFIEKPLNLVSIAARLRSQLQKMDYFRRLERARRMMQRYLSPRVATIAEEYSETGKVPPAEEREVAICFTDIRGFTARSETMDPVHLFDSLSGHLRRQVETVYRFGGYVDKFSGDGLMAVFDGRGMVRKCCECALLIMKETVKNHDAGETFPIGIGIHVGKVVIGNIGSPEHLDYSAVGPTVNLAARLCGYASPETIIVSGAIQQAMKESTNMQFMDERDVEIRGVKGSVKIFKLAARELD
jgi:class 3 adenylate cyclase